MFTAFRRVFKFALSDFYRNKGISLAAIFILTVNGLLFTGGFLAQGISNFLIKEINNKIDITAYFTSDTQEQSILDAKTQILTISPDIKSVEYVSKEQALRNFTEKHKDDVFLNALTEVGENPFLPSLNITTTGAPEQYEKIAKVLQGEQFSSIIEKVDFTQKKETIEKIFSITSNITRVGLGVSLVVVLVATLVVFNIIKLVIDRSRDEISTMRIVGASSWFVRTPFVIEGALFGFVAFIISLVVTAFATYFLSPGLSLILPGFNLFTFFLSNLLIIMLIQIGSGVGLGIAFSAIAVRRYVK